MNSEEGIITVMKRLLLNSSKLILASALLLCINSCNSVPANSENELVSNIELEYNMFMLDGMIYTLPVPYSELSDDGWITDEAKNITIENGEIFTCVLTNGDRSVIANITNYSEESITGDKGYIRSIVVAPPHTNADLITPFNITIGSAYDDVAAIYGNPYITMENENIGTYYFPEMRNISVWITVDVKTMLVVHLYMHYRDDRDDAST